MLKMLWTSFVPLSLHLTDSNLCCCCCWFVVVFFVVVVFCFLFFLVSKCNKITHVREINNSLSDQVEVHSS